MSMLQQPRTPRHYLASPPPSRVPTPQSSGKAPRAARQPEVDTAAAATVAEMAQRDVPRAASRAGERSSPSPTLVGGGTTPQCQDAGKHEDCRFQEQPQQRPSKEEQRLQLQRQREQQREEREQQREEQRQKLAATWYHTPRAFVLPKRANLSWFHGMRDEPIEFAAAVPSVADMGSAAAREEAPVASSRELPWLRQSRPSGRWALGEEDDPHESAMPAAIPGYTGFVGGRGDGTFGLGLSVTRQRAMAMERRRPFAASCGGGTHALGRLFGAWGGGVTDTIAGPQGAAMATGGKYSEGCCAGVPTGAKYSEGRASPTPLRWSGSAGPEARPTAQKPCASWASPRAPAPHGASSPT